MEPYRPILNPKDDIYNLYKWRAGMCNVHDNEDGWEICECVQKSNIFYWKKLRSNEERDKINYVLEKYYDMENCKRRDEDNEENKLVNSEVDELNIAYLNISQHQELSDISEIKNDGESNILDISNDFEEEEEQ